MGMHVFISYQRTDQRHAEELTTALQAHGIPVFVDLKIQAGECWDQELEIAINDSFAVLPIWTAASVQSRWVRIEARYGLRLGLLCPVLRETCDVPLEFSDIEFADLRLWRKENTDHPEWRNLVESLFRLQQSGRRTRPNSDAELCFRLGVRFLDGVNVPQNTPMAIMWLRKAAELKHDRATALLRAVDEPESSATLPENDH
ncbi:MAG: TIR domain-containing protein [Planctomycetaceae bacterium]